MSRSGCGIATTRIAQIHTEFATLDVTLRAFNPEQRPSTIKARVKRRGPARFRTGELSRAILATLRQALAPMSVRDLAASVAAEHALDVVTPKAFKALVANVRAALSRPREGLVREAVEGAYVWRLTL